MVVSVSSEQKHSFEKKRETKKTRETKETATGSHTYEPLRNECAEKRGGNVKSTLFLAKRALTKLTRSSTDVSDDSLSS